MTKFCLKMNNKISKMIASVWFFLHLIIGLQAETGIFLQNIGWCYNPDGSTFWLLTY
jgi:hypothetical protein